MRIRNEDVSSMVVEIPEGHRHLRNTVRLRDGREFTLQEATVANLLRAFVGVKTHPLKTRVELRARELSKRKEGYAEWQLLEVEDEDV
jgi:hypothetical protein